MRIKWQNWIWLPAASLGGALSVILALPECEPITGFDSKRELIGLFLFAIFCFGGSAFLVFKSKWYWKFLAVLLFLIGLVFSVPLPSKGGIRIHLINENDQQIEVAISRVEQSNRIVRKALPSHTEVIYYTAPGDYAESLEIKMQSGNKSLETSIVELRHNRVAFTPTEIVLQPFSK